MSRLMEEFMTLKSIYGVENVDMEANLITIKPLTGSAIKVAVFLPDDYPNKPPIVTVEGLSDISNEEQQQLDMTLLEVSMENVGEPMVYTLITEIKQWINERAQKNLNQENNSKVECTNDSQDTTTVSQEAEEVIVQVSKTAEPGMSSTAQVNNNICQETSTGKKPRMRTAQDVIKRIQWDERLDSLNFSVGYEDRFLGVLEKPFNDFTWKDLASVGIDDLAIPQHRIQYFKYKEVIVWDKRQQMDDVFGSRGGRTIYDVLEYVDGCEAPEYELNFGSEDEGEDEDIEDGDITIADLQSKGSEQIDKNEQQLRCKKAFKRPNFFLCFKVDSDSVIKKVNQVQQYILSQDERLQQLFIPLDALHVTLCMLKLRNLEELETAKQVLQELQEVLASLLVQDGEPLKVHFKGVSHFRDRVIFAQLDTLENSLVKAVTVLREKFKDANIPVSDDYRDFTPHLTILKLSPKKAHELKMKFIDRGLYFPYTNTTFGTQQIRDLNLCSVNSPFQKDGFYLVVKKLLLCSSLCNPHVTEFLRTVYESWKHREDIQVEDSFFPKIQNLLESIPSTFSQIKQLISSGMDGKYEGLLLVIRGVPGIGRSYVANHFVGLYEDQVAILDFGQLYQENPNYAISLQLEQFIKKVKDNSWLIIANGVFQNRWEYDFLIQLATVINYAVKIVELTCDVGSPGLKIVAARSRERHKLGVKEIERMLSRWEIDERSNIINAYIEKVAEVHDPCSEVQQICEDTVKKVRLSCKQSNRRGRFIKYSAIFLSYKQSRRLLDVFGSAYNVVSANHVTLQYQPSMDDIQDLVLGSEVKIVVNGVADDGQIQVVRVAIQNRPASWHKIDEIPHITISHKEGIPPALAGSLLCFKEGQLVKPVTQQQQICLDGVVGCLVDVGLDTDGVHSAKVFHRDTLTLYYNNFKRATAEFEHHYPQLLLGARNMITQLHVFDFDGTLFDHPNNPQSRYADSANNNIMEVDSFKLDEDVPLIPCQGLPLYRRYCGSPDSKTIILTGRWSGYYQDMKSLLARQGLPLPDQFIFKPNECELPTAEFKSQELQKFLVDTSDIQKVWILDDLPEVLAAYSRLAQTEFGSKYQFEIHDVAGQQKLLVQKQWSNSSILQGDGLFQYLGRHGYFMDPVFEKCAHEGIEFILEIWSNTLGYEEDMHNLVMVQGGFAMGRMGDVDIALLAPYGIRQSDCAKLLYDELQSKGVEDVYLSPASNLPRVRCRLSFQGVRKIEYDIVFCRVERHIFFNGFQTTEDLQAVIQNDDEASKRALEGQTMLDNINKVIGYIENHERSAFFTVVVEALVRIFKTAGMYGNAFHCPRTVHLTRIVVDAIDQVQSKSIQINCPTELFEMVVDFAVKRTFDQWRQHFNKFVPKEYIEDIMRIFHISQETLKSPQIGNNKTWECSVQFQQLFNLLGNPKTYSLDLTSKGYALVGLEVQGNVQQTEYQQVDDTSLWQLGIFVEARAQSYVRKMLDSEIQLKPWKFLVCNKSSRIVFEVAVRQEHAQGEVVNTLLNQLIKEIQQFAMVYVVQL